MAATNRSDKLKLLVKALQKRYKHFPKPAERNLLECLMFAACLENATFDAAESAYSVLEHHYIDWNELRVSTPQEIADTLPMLPHPLEAGERIKKTLQGVFETTYMFDLEDYRKKTIGQTVEYLDSIPSCTPFMIHYLVQIGLGGHQIPIDEAALRILRRLDLTKVNNGREGVSCLERVITKSKSIEFTSLLHLFGVEFFDRQDDQELLALLQSIDKNAAERPWQEPKGVCKKSENRPIPARTSPTRSSGFKPEMDLDDDEGELAGPVSKEESVEFIDTGLPLPGAGTKGNEVKSGGSGSSKRKKQASGKTGSKKKSPEPVIDPKSQAVIPDNETAADMVEPEAESQAEPLKKEKETEKKTNEKAAQAHKKTETKKTASQKIDKKTPQKPPPEKDPVNQELKKSTQATPPKSATKKLQQKKPR